MGFKIDVRFSAEGLGVSLRIDASNARVIVEV